MAEQKESGVLGRHHLFVPTKMGYVTGDRPKVDCILCAVIRGYDIVDRL